VLWLSSQSPTSRMPPWLDKAPPFEPRFPVNIDPLKEALASSLRPPFQCCCGTAVTHRQRPIAAVYGPAELVGRGVAVDGAEIEDGRCVLEEHGRAPGGRIVVQIAVKMETGPMAKRPPRGRPCCR